MKIIIVLALSFISMAAMSETPFCERYPKACGIVGGPPIPNPNEFTTNILDSQQQPGEPCYPGDTHCTPAPFPG